MTFKKFQKNSRSDKNSKYWQYWEYWQGSIDIESIESKGGFRVISKSETEKTFFLTVQTVSKFLVDKRNLKDAFSPFSATRKK